MALIPGVRLSNGRVLPYAAALVGVGALPNGKLGRAAGLPCDSGIVADTGARTADPDLWAVGDVTRRPPLLIRRRNSACSGSDACARRLRNVLRPPPAYAAEAPLLLPRTRPAW